MKSKQKCMKVGQSGGSGTKWWEKLPQDVAQGIPGKLVTQLVWLMMKPYVTNLVLTVLCGGLAGLAPLELPACPVEANPVCQAQGLDG